MRLAHLSAVWVGQPFICWILSLNRVVAMAVLCGWPRDQAAANFVAVRS